MGSSLQGKAADVFAALKERGVLQKVVPAALNLKNGVLGLACVDDRNRRLRDVCQFHERLQEEHRDESKSIVITVPGSTLAFALGSPFNLKVPNMARGYLEAIRLMLDQAGLDVLLGHNHYGCLAAEIFWRPDQLFEVTEQFFSSKARLKKEFGGITVATMCQFEPTETEKNSYFLSREQWEGSYEDLRQDFVLNPPVFYSFS